MAEDAKHAAFLAQPVRVKVEEAVHHSNPVQPVVCIAFS
jgi:hypothetical protein